MKTSMSNLPNHLEEEILSMIPFSSRGAVRLTCKKWNTLVKSRSFTTMHIGKQGAAAAAAASGASESGESRMVVMMDYNVCLTSVVFVNEHENPSTKPLGKLTCLDNEQVKISDVFHCDGLLLCVLKDDNTRFVVVDIAFSDRGVSLKGNTYWCATDGRGLIHYTVCFDFTRKRFGGLQDLPFRVPYKQLVTLSCVRDEKLSVLLQSMDRFVINIWITDKIEEQKVAWGKSLRVDDTAKKVAWSKFLRVNMGLVADLRTSDGRFFIEEEKKVAMVVNKDTEARSDTVKIFGEDGYFSELELGEPCDRWCWPVMCSYARSLVQIKLTEGGKRNSEMHKKVAQRRKRFRNPNFHAFH